MQTVISKIDQEIAAIYAKLTSLEKFDQCIAAHWQAAWDRHPELREREAELYRLRGIAQQERDEKAQKIWAKQKRQSRPKKCPTCGCKTLAA